MAVIQYYMQQMTQGELKFTRDKSHSFPLLQSDHHLGLDQTIKVDHGQTTKHSCVCHRQKVVNTAFTPKVTVSCLTSGVSTAHVILSLPETEQEITRYCSEFSV